MSKKSKKYCSDCGEAHPTGSQIWFICSIDGKWISGMAQCRFSEEELKKCDI